MNQKSNSIKSDHALKKSLTPDQSTFSHLNPLSKKPTLSKKHSLNNPHDAHNLTINHIRFQPKKVTELVLNPQQNEHLYMQKRNGIEAKEGRTQELALRIDRMEAEIERQQKKIWKLENENEMKKEQFVKKELLHNVISEIVQKNKISLSTQNQRIFSDIQKLKLDLNRYAPKIQLNQSLNDMKQIIFRNTELLKRQIAEIVKNKEFQDEKYFQNIEKLMEDKLKTVQAKIGWKMNQYEECKNSSQSSSSSLLNSNELFEPPFFIKLESSLKVIGEKRQIQLQRNEVVYKIDGDGYLLDAENRYLVDESNKQLRLTVEQIEMLKSKKVLK